MQFQINNKVIHNFIHYLNKYNKQTTINPINVTANYYALIIKTNIQQYFSPKLLNKIIELILKVLIKEIDVLTVNCLLQKCNIQQAKYVKIQDYIKFIFISFRLWFQKFYLAIKCKNNTIQIFTIQQKEQIIQQLELQLNENISQHDKLKYEIQPIYDPINIKFRPIIQTNYQRLQELLVQQVLKNFIQANNSYDIKLIKQSILKCQQNPEQYIILSLDIQSAYSQINQQDLLSILTRIVDSIDTTQYTTFYFGLTYGFSKEQLLKQLYNFIIKPMISIFCKKYYLTQGITQGGLLSPMFCYIYYNTKLKILYKQQLLNNFTSIVYVDDILIYGKKEDCINIKNKIQELFQCKNKNKWLTYSIPSFNKCIDTELQVQEQFSQLLNYCKNWNTNSDYIIQQLINILQIQSRYILQFHDRQLYYFVNKKINQIFQQLLYYNKSNIKQFNKLLEYIFFITNNQCEFLFFVENFQMISSLIISVLQNEISQKCDNYYDKQTNKCVDTCESQKYIQYFNCIQDCNTEQYKIINLNNIQFCLTELQSYQFTQEDITDCNQFIYQNHCVTKEFCQNNLLYINASFNFCYNPPNEQYCNINNQQYVYDIFYHICISKQNCNDMNLIVNQYICQKQYSITCQNEYKLVQTDICLSQCPQYTQIDIQNKNCIICQNFNIQSQKCVDNCQYQLNISNQFNSLICTEQSDCKFKQNYNSNYLCVDNCEITDENRVCIDKIQCVINQKFLQYIINKNYYVCVDQCNEENYTQILMNDSTDIKTNYCVNKQYVQCLQDQINDTQICVNYCSENQLIQLTQYQCFDNTDNINCKNERILKEQRYCDNKQQDSQIQSDYYIIEAGYKKNVTQNSNAYQLMNTSQSINQYQQIESCQTYIIENLCISQEKYDEIEEKQVFCQYYKLDIYNDKQCVKQCDEYLYDDIYCIQHCQKDQYVNQTNVRYCIDECTQYIIIQQNYDQICTSFCPFQINIEKNICQDQCELPNVFNQQKNICESCEQTQVANRSIYSQQYQKCISIQKCSYINITIQGNICEMTDSQYCKHYYVYNNYNLCVDQCQNDIESNECQQYQSQDCNQEQEYKYNNICMPIKCPYYQLVDNVKQCTQQCTYKLNLYAYNQQQQCQDDCNTGYTYQYDNQQYCVDNCQDDSMFALNATNCTTKCQIYYSNQQQKCVDTCQFYLQQFTNKICLDTCKQQYLQKIQDDLYECKQYCQFTQIIEIQDKQYYECIEQSDKLYYQQNNFTIYKDHCLQNTFKQENECLWIDCQDYIVQIEEEQQCQDNCDSKIIDKQFNCLESCQSGFLIEIQTKSNKLFYCNEASQCQYYQYKQQCVFQQPDKYIHQKLFVDNCKEINMINSYYIINDIKYKVCSQNCQYGIKEINEQQYCVQDCYPQIINLNNICKENEEENKIFVGQYQQNGFPTYYQYYTLDSQGNKHFVEKCNDFILEDNQCIEYCDNYVYQIRDIYYCKQNCDQDVYQYENLQFCINCEQQLLIYKDVYICKSGQLLGNNVQIRQYCINQNIYFDKDKAECTSSCERYYSGNYQCTQECETKIYKIMADMKQCQTSCDQYYVIQLQDNGQNYSQCIQSCPPQHQFIENNQCKNQCTNKFINSDKLCINACTNKVQFVKQNLYKCIEQCDKYEYQITINIKQYYQCQNYCQSSIIDENEQICQNECNKQYLQTVEQYYLYKCVDNCENYQQYITLINFNQKQMKLCTVECQSYYYIFESKHTCSQNCNVYYETTLETKCIENCTDKFYITTSTNKTICVDACQTPTLLFSKIEGDKCLSTCSEDLPYLSSLGYCTLNCSDGTYLQNDICINQCKGSEYISYQGKCITECPEQTILQYKTDKYSKYKCVENCDERQFKTENINIVYSFSLQYMCTDWCQGKYDIFNLQTKQLMMQCQNQCKSNLFFQRKEFCIDILDENDLSQLVLYQDDNIMTDFCKSLEQYRDGDKCYSNCKPQQFIFQDVNDQYCQNDCNYRVKIDQNYRYCNETCTFELKENQHVCNDYCTISYLNNQCTETCNNQYYIDQQKCILMENNVYTVTNGNNYKMFGDCQYQFIYLWNGSQSNKCIQCNNTKITDELCVQRCKNDLYNFTTKYCTYTCGQYLEIDSDNNIYCTDNCSQNNYYIYENMCVSQCPESNQKGEKIIYQYNQCVKEQQYNQNQLACLQYQKLENNECKSVCSINTIYNTKTQNCDSLGTQEIDEQIQGKWYFQFTVQQCNQFQYEDKEQCLQNCDLYVLNETQNCLLECNEQLKVNWQKSICQEQCPQYLYNTSNQCISSCDQTNNYHIQNYCLERQQKQQCSYYTNNYGECIDNCNYLLANQSKCLQQCAGTYGNYTYQSRCVQDCPQDMKFYYTQNRNNYCSNNDNINCKYYSINADLTKQIYCSGKCGTTYNYLNNTCTVRSSCTYKYSDSKNLCYEYCGAQYISNNNLCSTSCGTKINSYGKCVFKSNCYYMSENNNFCYDTASNCEVIQNKVCKSACSYFNEKLQCIDSCSSTQYQLQLITGIMCLQNCYSYSKYNLEYMLYNMPDQTCVSVCPVGYLQLKENCTKREQYNRKCDIYQSLSDDFKCINDVDVENENGYVLYPKSTDKIITECAAVYNKQCIYRQCLDYQVWIIDGCYEEDLCYGKIEFRIENDYTARVCVYDEQNGNNYELI